MNFSVTAIVVIVSLLAVGCSGPVDKASKQTTPQQEILQNIEELKQVAETGDLVVRLNDDLISERVRYINERDHSYSHTGIVVERNNIKVVAHIAPEAEGGDTIQYIPIDTFINPAKHVSCALYRYDISNQEKNFLVNKIEEFKNNNVRFDRVYDLESNDKLYCSEMIAKSLKAATNNRINCRETVVPKKMQKVVAKFFSKEGITSKIVAERKIMTIDNLYLRPDCSLVTQFKLKYFPDQVYQ